MVYVGMQFMVGDVFVLVGVVVFLDDGGLIVVFGEVVVEIVSGEVQGVIFILFDGNIIWCEGGVFYMGIGLYLVKDFVLFVLKCIRVGYGLLVLCFVLIWVNQVMFCNISGNRVFVNLVYGFFFFLNLLNIC